MTPWAKTIRRETGLIEHICKEHGVGHPAAASVHWMALHGQNMGVHGCCGCCRDMEWRLADATNGYEIANKLLKKSIKENNELRNKAKK